MIIHDSNLPRLIESQLFSSWSLISKPFLPPKIPAVCGPRPEPGPQCSAFKACPTRSSLMGSVWVVSKPHIDHPKFGCTLLSGWWCNNHLEQYESQWEGLSPILSCKISLKPIHWKIENVWNHQPVWNPYPLERPWRVHPSRGSPISERAIFTPDEHPNFRRNSDGHSGRQEHHWSSS